MAGDMRCGGPADDVGCDREPLPGKKLCEYHDWLATSDPAFRGLLDHLGKLLTREYVALQRWKTELAWLRKRFDGCYAEDVLGASSATEALVCLAGDHRGGGPPQLVRVSTCTYACEPLHAVRNRSVANNPRPSWGGTRDRVRSVGPALPRALLRNLPWSNVRYNSQYWQRAVRAMTPRILM
jgi:hypothetical protein